MGAKLSAPLKRPIETTTPGALTPARTSTPPPQTERSRFEPRPGPSDRNGRMGARGDLSRHSSLDTDALDSALRREIGRPHRDSTPGASPSRKRQRINGDRYVELASPPPLHSSRIQADKETPGSSPPVLDKISKQASVCSTRMDLLRRHRGKRSGRHMASFIFRRVSSRALRFPNRALTFFSQLRRRTAHSLRSCEPSCLRAPSPKQHRRV